MTRPCKVCHRQHAFPYRQARREDDERLTLWAAAPLALIAAVCVYLAFVGFLVVAS